ncbi:hypothetical protein AJ80_06090 [Polytolypa hystricis UAMH7299]|uniref:chitinase n=1 Tax=Polytolypa hystricis (strain UAMH7299) TaxID=1447883 RepID=A0A2B7XXY8_POLH7|nr:hypothetical protein AJ80_06090 [Polytolypa hystricis UAMH7299]
MFSSRSFLLATWFFLYLVALAVGSDEFRNIPFPAKDSCPVRCSITGPDPSDWTVYYSLEELSRCGRTILLDFAIHTPIDESDKDQRVKIRSCAIWGGDFSLFDLPTSLTGSTPVNITLQKATFGAQSGTAQDADAISALRSLRQYFGKAPPGDQNPTIFFAISGTSVIGLYMGANFDSGKSAEPIINGLISDISANGLSQTSVFQLCGPDHNAGQTLGIVVVTNSSLSAAQNALTTWATAKCVTGAQMTSHISNVPVHVNGPLTIPANSTTNMTSPRRRRHGHSVRRHSSLAPRADCRTVQVDLGDSCAALATRCGITGNDFTNFNPGANFCSTLQPGQRVCCSSGSLPSFAPNPNADGSCADYSIDSGDTCSSIAATYDLTTSKLEEFNKNTWGWNGCNLLWVDTVICLSTGNPPMPAAVSNAVCGPQVPGTKPPADWDNLANLNPCPLKACCNVWGQCGITDEFCTDTSTGAPGTAEPGTNGCISNCGTDIVSSSPPATFRKIAYFQGYNLGRPCLYMDATQIDSSFTHVQFGFGTLTPEFQVVVSKPGDNHTAYEFEAFKGLKGVKRVLSFGGWDFSTSPSTFNIFREGVQPNNRLTMATNIANFIKSNGLDGVDIDWEYPGAPDMPDIPAGGTDEGILYYKFLVTLRGLLDDGMSLSIAAPASYWYLKAFPIAQISTTVDYIIYMTYDLHGLWDLGNQWSQEGCPAGNCLRSHINITETKLAMSMITKAGAPSNKIVMGVSSYGRSFQMTQPGCTGPMCTAGNAVTKGQCTDTAGYIAEAEIKEIVGEGKKNRKRQNVLAIYDVDSDSNILVYDGDQWVSWMDDEIKSRRIDTYKGLDFGGSTDWAVDLAEFRESPADSGGWDNFKKNIDRYGDPYIQGERSGNWSSFNCDHPAVQHWDLFTSEARWDILGCDNAWEDAIAVWKASDKGGDGKFVRTLRKIFGNLKLDMQCHTLTIQNLCNEDIACYEVVGPGSGPAGALILTSLTKLHREIANFHHALESANVHVLAQFPSFANKFAPIPDNVAPFNIIMDLLGMGGTIIAAPFFNSWLSKTSYFSSREDSFDTLKDTANALIGGFVNTIKNTYKDPKCCNREWDEEAQNDFLAYVGNVFFAWGNGTEFLVKDLYSGDDDPTDLLWKTISNGKLISGSEDTNTNTEPSMSATQLQVHVERAFYGFIIPQLWNASGTDAFVMETGYKCGTEHPMREYILDNTGTATWVCHEPTDKMYYLVAAKGDATTCECHAPCMGGPPPCSDNTFSAPPGLDALDGESLGEVTRVDLVHGAVASYKNNNNKNGWKAPDPSTKEAFDRFWKDNIRAPGYVQLPVCSAEEAWNNWRKKTSNKDFTTDNYPCN